MSLLAVLLVVLSLTSCIDEPEFSDEPSISFVSYSKDSLDQGPLVGDSVFVRFDFEDGDGDLGSEDESSIFFIDTRQDFIFSSFRMPVLPEPGNDRAVQGSVTVKLLTTCCIDDQGNTCPTDDPSLTEDVIYEVYLIDRAGNESDRITLPPLTIRCN